MNNAQWNDRPDADVARYRALSAAAIVGLLFGILSPAAMLHWLLWGVPLAGIAVSLLALAHIKRQAPALVGRQAAIVGLLLSVGFGTAAVADWFTYRRLIDTEARQAAALWFEALADEKPLAAHQLALTPKYRASTGDNLQKFYQEAPRWHEELESYLQQKLIRTLLVLDGRAHVRYWATLSIGSAQQRDQVSLLYAVTFDEQPQSENAPGRRTTFFVKMNLQRETLKTGQPAWQIMRTEVVEPPSEVGSGKSGMAASAAMPRNSQLHSLYSLHDHDLPFFFVPQR